jgi:hypothetical protein
MSELRLMLEQIATARRYTLGLLQGLPDADWYRMAGGVTHVVWQVGHLAFAEYRLVLHRVRGPRPEDAALIPAAYTELFGRESVPDAFPNRYPSPAEVRAVLDAVHRQVLADLPALPEAELGTVLVPPHRVARTKREMLWWCVQHEMIHAGQIGLLRRLLGHAPQW